MVSYYVSYTLGNNSKNHFAVNAYVGEKLVIANHPCIAQDGPSYDSRGYKLGSLLSLALDRVTL